MFVSLVLLTVVLFFLTLYSIVQTNAKVFHLEDSPFVSLKLLDTSTAASLFVTLIGALLVRHQFASSVTPRINYRSAKTERYDKQNRDEVFQTWHVEIHNTGLGSAIINRVDYLFEPAGSKNCSSSYSLDNIVKQFAAIDLIPERDYWMQNMSSGFSLAAKDDFFVFEINMKSVEKMTRLDMVLYFQSQLGNRYRRVISLLPQRR